MIASGGQGQTREAVEAAKKNARAVIKAAEEELKRGVNPEAQMSLLGGDAKEGPNTKRKSLLEKRIQDAKTVLALNANEYKTQAEKTKAEMESLMKGLDVGGTGTGTGSGSGSGNSAADRAKEQLDAGKQLSKEFTRQNALLKTQNEFDKRLLQNKYDFEDAVAEINQNCRTSSCAKV